MWVGLSVNGGQGGCFKMNYFQLTESVKEGYLSIINLERGEQRKSIAFH